MARNVCAESLTPQHLAVLAGFSDPVYAEAYVTVHQYDIVLDVTVINRTAETLQNLCLELATMGDLKLVERPQNYTLGPAAQKSIRHVLCNSCQNRHCMGSFS
jgi:vesicle coat complex subunit